MRKHFIFFVVTRSCHLIAQDYAGSMQAKLSQFASSLKLMSCKRIMQNSVGRQERQVWLTREHLLQLIIMVKSGKILYIQKVELLNKAHHHG
jgi:hypothetical protein